MTNNEAIKRFETLLLHVDTNCVMGMETTEAINLAIKALEQPVAKDTNAPINDCIGRQAAIDAVLADKIDDKSLEIITALGDGRLALTLNDACDRHIRAIEQLPPAQPEIIRCKDCRWHKDQSGATAWLPCRAIVTPSEFYCGRAERRTKDEDTL